MIVACQLTVSVATIAARSGKTLRSSVAAGVFEFSGLAAFIVPGPGRAQKALPLVAVLHPVTQKQAIDRVAAIRAGYRKAGFSEGVDYALAKASNTCGDNKH